MWVLPKTKPSFYLTFGLLVSLALLSCGAAPAKMAYSTRHGLHVYFHEKAHADRWEVEWIVDEVLYQYHMMSPNVYSWNRMYDRLDDALPIMVHGWFKAIKCKVPSGWCNGLFKPWRIDVRLNQDCLAKTSLGHEAMHLVYYMINNASDPDHLAPGIWVKACRKLSGEAEIACVKDTLEYRVTTKTQRALCQQN
jgi:hypothetical protein